MSIETRLARLEARANRPELVPDVSIIYPFGGAWRLDFGLTNGKTGGGRTVTTYHDTESEAAAEYDRRLEHYPEKPEPTLIICDV